MMAQDKPAPTSLEFEVATIKPVDPSLQMRSVGITIYPGGRVVISTLPLKTLIAAAFRLSYGQIAGGDAWVEKDEYDIQAKPPENSGITNLRYTWYEIEDSRLREMLQALLIERFQLKFHREKKMGDVYILARNGKTLGLHPTEFDSRNPDTSTEHGSPGSIGYGRGRWVIANATMPQLAKFADRVLRAPVLDRTGLAGAFDYEQPPPDLDPNYSDSTDSFLGLMPKLGLKLERSKGPVERFVIDFAAKPSPN